MAHYCPFLPLQIPHFTLPFSSFYPHHHPLKFSKIPLNFPITLYFPNSPPHFPIVPSLGPKNALKCAKIIFRVLAPLAIAQHSFIFHITRCYDQNPALKGAYHRSISGATSAVDLTQSNDCYSLWGVAPKYRAHTPWPPRSE